MATADLSEITQRAAARCRPVIEGELDRAERAHRLNELHGLELDTALDGEGDKHLVVIGDLLDALDDEMKHERETVTNDLDELLDE